MDHHEYCIVSRLHPFCILDICTFADQHDRSDNRSSLGSQQFGARAGETSDVIPTQTDTGVKQIENKTETDREEQDEKRRE